MNNKLQNILINKAKENKLSHFYIIEPSKRDSTNKCLEWIIDTIKSAYKLNQLDSHQDVLLLSKKDEKESYNKEDMSQIQNFFIHKSIELPQKFLILNNADKLSEINSNKLLKIFEEPPVKCSIFLINNTKTALLPTIKSRAITLRVSFISTQLEDSSSINDSFVQSDKTMSFEKFCTHLDENSIGIYDALAQLYDKYNLTSNLKDLNRLQRQLKEIENDLLYRNPASSIKLKIYHLFSNLHLN